MADHASEPAAQRDQDAWMAATAPRAVAYAASLLRDASLAEDIVQDCFCRLLQRRNQYNLEQDGVKLLFRSITNACINVSTRRRPVVSLHGQSKLDDDSSLDLPDTKTPPPDGALLHGELLDAVEAGLARLPVNQRAALQLKSLGHTQLEIAEALQTTSSHAGVLVHRARQALAEYLAPILGDRPS